MCRMVKQHITDSNYINKRSIKKERKKDRNKGRETDRQTERHRERQRETESYISKSVCI